MHPPKWQRSPDPALLERMLDAGGVHQMTLAPELPGAFELIDLLLERGVVVSAGHTDASAAEAHLAFDRGVRTVTHLFNAMRPLVPRDPGIALAALARTDVTVQLIADGHHVAGDTLLVAWQAARGRIALVTDAVAATAMGDGDFALAGRPLVSAEGVVRGPEGQLAGSVLTMIDAVRNVHALGVPLEEALTAAADVPARIAGPPGPRPARARRARRRRRARRQPGDRPRARAGRRPCRSLGRRSPSSPPPWRACWPTATARSPPPRDEIRRRAPRYAVIAARGSSDNAARYAQHVLGRLCGLPVALAVPSLHTVYDAPMRYADGLVIGISQSGASPDVVAVLAAARAQGCVTVAITNDPGSPMAAAATHVIALQAGAEDSRRRDQDVHDLARRGRRAGGRHRGRRRADARAGGRSRRPRTASSSAAAASTRPRRPPPAGGGSP